jgi:hypothetical protein
MRRKIWLSLLFILVTKTNVLATKFLSDEYFKSKQQEIRALIEDGYFNAAHLKCDSLLKQPLSNNQRYEIITTQSKMYFWEENMFAFKTCAEKAVQLKRNQPIYKAYYHAQIAFYYHYSFIGDSAIINSDKAISLLRKHFNDRHKIGSHFIYQMYASSCIYRSDYYLKSGNIVNDKRKKIVPIISYLDSALLSIEQHPYFPQEKAIIYRSLGNRLFDFVGYHVRVSSTDFEYPEFENEIFSKVIAAYQSAIRCMPSKENKLRKNLDAALAMAYYTCLKEQQADSITLPYINRFYINPIGEMSSNPTNSVSLLSYYIRNAIAKNYSPHKLLKVKSILERILPLWRMYMNLQNIHFFDAYDISPNHQLLEIHEYFLRKKPEWADKSFMLNLALDRFNYFSNYALSDSELNYQKTKFKALQTKIELNPNDHKAIKEISDLARLNGIKDYVKTIQQKLNKDEALVLSLSNTFTAKFFILVQKKDISIITHNNDAYFIEDKNIFNLETIKSKGYEMYVKSKILPIIIKRKIKKIYTDPLILMQFDWVVTNKKGKDFGELSFFKKQVNVVKVHNPIDFFLNQKEKIRLRNKIDYVWLNKASVNKLPFTRELIQTQKGKSPLFSVEQLKSKGILQIFGHGKEEEVKQYGGKNSSTESNEFSAIRAPNFKVKKELLILSVCYAGKRRDNNVFDLGINNLLLSNGAKAVIASPYQTVDQSSAYIFKKFYSYLFEGQTVEDALQNAKMNYLQNHTGQLAHPLYWSTYELTSNVKDLRLEPTRKPDYSWIGYLIVIVLTALVLRFYLFWEEY